MSTTIGSVVTSALGPDLTFRLTAYDGTSLGPEDAPLTIEIRSPDAINRLIHAPGELGLVRAYVSGDIEFHGNLWDLAEQRHALENFRVGPREMLGLARVVGIEGIRHRLPPPSEEAQPNGRLHSRSRDAEAVSHHYDVSNEFYRMLLGPTMTYSCAVFADQSDTLEQAQENKYELICQKLDLQPGMRLLDIGCGWGGMLLHAARNHGVTCVGITLSCAQADLARKRVAEAGLAEEVEIRIQDYRDVGDGPFDAISSIGMMEHVGSKMLDEYFSAARALLRTEGRFLNHAIGRPAPKRNNRIARDGFIGRYIFPDAELHEVGAVVSAMQRNGFEVRHMESLREHYALTLRKWTANLEANWDEAVAEVGIRRVKIWHLYLAFCAIGFEDNINRIDQVLASKTSERGASGFPLRPTWTV